MTAPTDDPPNDDIARAAKAAAILGAIFTIAALGLFGARVAMSVVIGAAIAVANLVTMRAIIRALLQAPPASEESTTNDNDEPPAVDSEKKSAASSKTAADHKGAGRRGGVAWGVFAVLKIVILFGGVWILLTRGLVDPMPLVVGYGVLPLGIAAGSLWSSLRPSR